MRYLILAALTVSLFLSGGCTGAGNANRSAGTPEPSRGSPAPPTATSGARLSGGPRPPEH